MSAIAWNAVRDGNGITVRHQWNAQGNVLAWVEAKGQPEQRTTRYSWDQWGNLLSKTRGSGDGQGGDAITETYTYDNAGNTTKGTNGLGHTTSATHSAQGQTLTATNPLGHTARHTYDAAGNLTSSTNALGQSTKFSYDGRARRTQVTSAAGRVQTTSYDKAGRITETLALGQAAGQGTRVQYDAAGRPVQTTSPSGLISKTSYDSQGRTASTQDPAGNTTSYEYGAKGSPLAGLLVTVNYPTYKESYGYDQRGRQTVTHRHLDATTTLSQRQAFDAEGQRLSSTDPAGKTTLYQYDGLGRMVQTIDATGGKTQQTWDAQDNLTSLTDAKGNKHQFSYDKAGRLTKETRPMGGAIGYAYDAAGNLTTRTDAGGNTRSYTYNQAGRMTAEVHKLNGSSTDQSISYSHDQDGQLTAYEQKDGQGSLISSASYAKDAQGRTATSSIQYGKLDGSGQISFQIGQNFNADGQLQSHTYPDGSTQSYSYQSGRLAKVTLPNQSEISYGNYSWMVPGQIQTPGATKTLTYDSQQRPTGIEVKNPANQILASRSYQYDAAGNITEIDSDLGKTSYGYDQLDRLTQASPDNALQAKGLPNESYGYDSVGNRTSSGHQAGAWRYNADNQLIQYPKTVPLTSTPAVDTSVTYTPQGHTAEETNSQGSRTYSYNAAERLTRIADTGQGGQGSANLQADYRYDPFGRRIAKSVKEGSSTNTTWFIYSEGGLMGEANEAGQVTKAYGFNPTATQQGLWSTDPIWQANTNANSLTGANAQYHYLHTDHLGTPMLATTANGSTSWKTVTEAFGAANAITGSNTTVNLRFPGQYFDAETRMHYNLHRDYSPNAGRYIEGDPLNVPDGGVNIYSYSAANPMMLSDPWGLVEWKGAYAYFAFDLNISKKLTAKFFRIKFGPGGGFMVGGAALSTKCVGGKRGRVKINFAAAFFSAGVGILDKVQSSAEGAGITCEAPMNVESFNGAFGFASVGAGPFAATLIRFGSATCPSPSPTRTPGDFTQASTDLLSFTGAVGVSVASGKIEDCCSE